MIHKPMKSQSQRIDARLSVKTTTMQFICWQVSFCSLCWVLFIFIFIYTTHTALYHESKNFEDWEGLKVEADMEKYIWENNKSKKSATEILNWNNTSSEIAPPKDYGESVEALMNEGENDYNLNGYKERVTQMLGLQAQWPMPKSMENVSIKHENELKQSVHVSEQNKSSDRTFWYHP